MGNKPEKPGTLGTRFTQRRKEIYLAELRRTGRKEYGRIAANVSATCVQQHRKKDPNFLEAEEQAMLAYNLSLEEEIHRRGVEGVAKPTTVAGKRELVRDYSDRLLIEKARAHIDEYKPHVKIDQKTQHSGSLALEADLSKLDATGRALLRKLLQCEIDDSDEEDDGISEEEAGAETE